MRKRVGDKIIPMVLTLLTFLLAFYQLLKIYHMESQFNRNILIIALFCLIAGFFTRWFVKLPLYLLVLCGGLFLNFSQNLSFSLTWASAFGQQLFNLGELFLAGRIGYLPEEIAISLVLLVMSLLAELLIEYERIVISYLIIIGYMLFLIIYNDIELPVEIVLFASLGLMYRFLLVHEKNKRNYFIVGTLLSVFLLITWAVPNDSIETRMLAPSATLRNYLNEQGFYQFIEETGAGNPTRSGFSEDDAVLGGPLLDDNQIVFEAQQQSPHYWRIDSKTYYSGSGWEDPASGNTRVESYSGEEIDLIDEDYQAELAEEEEINLTREVMDSYIPLPYGNKQINSEDPPAELYVNEETQRVDFQNNDPFRSFQLNWQDFEYTTEELADVSLTIPNTSVDYLQLPEQLPQRVIELAEELTAEEETFVGKVTAIEDYLKHSENFRYSKMDAGFPTENQDYVDHFLFDFQVGYCDNFSSAMVVMLRSVGIPARWAKGFSTGEEVSENHYVVRNSDAHSWAEVYFEGYGWLPFEATPSFNQPLQQTTPSSEEVSESSSEERTTTQETTEETGTEESSSTAEDSSTTTTSTVTEPTNERPFFISPVVRNIFYMILFVLTCGLIYILWRWHFYLYIFFWVKISRGNFLNIYPILLKKAEKFVLRPPEQPLSHYAQIFEESYPEFQQSFIHLTSIYEKALYGGEQEDKQSLTQSLLDVAWRLSQIKKKRNL
ncbi:transglutaminase domain-containing protein [Tetragenococcus halophilus]|uniref:transglutaminase domain-containing protein n=1 Tax=Tetragenococcus halophilus TaxID=51669 RepID=UPI00102FF5F3